MKSKNFLIAGSILSADLLNLEQDVKQALDEGVDVIHFDVMDYHFVPNMTFGPAFLKAMRQKFPKAIFDVHLIRTQHFFLLQVCRHKQLSACCGRACPHS